MEQTSPTSSLSQNDSFVRENTKGKRCSSCCSSNPTSKILCYIALFAMLVTMVIIITRLVSQTDSGLGLALLQTQSGQSIHSKPITMYETLNNDSDHLPEQQQTEHLLKDFVFLVGIILVTGIIMALLNQLVKHCNPVCCVEEADAKSKSAGESNNDIEASP